MTTIVHIPNDLTGPAGGPIPTAVLSLLTTMATLRWGPLDWGEDDGQFTELVFEALPSTDDAKRWASHFVACGGYV